MKLVGQMNDECVPDGNWSLPPIGGAQLSSRGNVPSLAPPPPPWRRH